MQIHNAIRAACAAAVVVSMTPARTMAAGGTTKYPWNIPDNVRIVQTSPVDNVRTFASITAALNSITTASDGNRFVVKVMPGTYAESVVLKPYVTLEGSGPDSTVLTTPPDSTAGYTVSAGTGTRIENLTITKNGALGREGVVDVQANASVVIENAKIVMPASAYVYALRSNVGASVELSHTHVLLAAGTTSSGDVAVDFQRGGAQLKIRDSRFEINSAGSNIFVAVLNPDTPAEIYDTVFDLTCSYGAIEAVDSLSSTTTLTKLSHVTIRVSQTDPRQSNAPALWGVLQIDSSTIVGTGQTVYAAVIMGPSTIHNSTLVTDLGGLYVGSDTRIVNSVVGGTAGLGISSGSAVFRAANSQIIGGHDGAAGSDRITNCVDGNFDPIPPL